MEEPGRATVHGVAKSRTRLSDFTFLPFINRIILETFYGMSVYIMEGFWKKTQETTMVAFWEREVALRYEIKMDSLFITYPIVLVCFLKNKSVLLFFKLQFQKN